jgi:hypothetical protein
MNFELILDCWRSGQIEPSEMVKLCRDNPQLQAILEAPNKALARALESVA